MFLSLPSNSVLTKYLSSWIDLIFLLGGGIDKHINEHSYDLMGLQMIQVAYAPRDTHFHFSYSLIFILVEPYYKKDPCVHFIQTFVVFE